MKAHQCVYTYMCWENGLTGLNNFFIAHCNSLGKAVRPEVTYCLYLKGRVRDMIATHTAEQG